YLLFYSCAIIVITKFTVDAAASIRRPIHSVICKVALNYWLALSVLNRFDITQIKMYEWNVALGEALRNVFVPQWVGAVMKTIVFWKGELPWISVKAAIMCLMPHGNDRYISIGVFYLVLPFLLLSIVTVLSALGLAIRRVCKAMFKFSRTLGKSGPGPIGFMRRTAHMSVEAFSRNLNNEPRLLSIWRVFDGATIGVAPRFISFMHDMIPVYVTTLYLIWSPVTDTMLELLECEIFEIPMASGAKMLSRRWVFDPDLVCYSGMHTSLTVIAVIGLLVWTVGAPVLGLYILHRGKATSRLNDAQFLRRYGFLYLGFEEHCWYWEALKRAQALAYGVVSTWPLGDVKARLVM
ncbi:hypothetical protein Pmar_PMAR003875, partial [Perkinsus marinus ATCC 50983]